MTTTETLAAIREAEGLEEYLDSLEERLARTVASHPGLVAAVGNEALAAGGKRLRPVLVFLSTPPGREPSLAAGVAVELVHMATLVHDDLIDRAHFRRGKAAAWSVYGADAARATGDYLFARAFAELAAAGDAGAVNVLAVIHGSKVRSGVFGDVVEERGHRLEEWSLAWGRPSPRPIDDYSAVLVFGGSMHADQDDRHPWLPTHPLGGRGYSAGRGRPLQRHHASRSSSRPRTCAHCKRSGAPKCGHRPARRDADVAAAARCARGRSRARRARGRPDGRCARACCRNRRARTLAGSCAGLR